MFLLSVKGHRSVVEIKYYSSFQESCDEDVSRMSLPLFGLPEQAVFVFSASLGLCECVKLMCNLSYTCSKYDLIKACATNNVHDFFEYLRCNIFVKRERSDRLVSRVPEGHFVQRLHTILQSSGSLHIQLEFKFDMRLFIHDQYRLTFALTIFFF